MRAGRSDLCLLFASKQEDKFDHVAWRRTASGLPLLELDVLAWAECTTEYEREVGDHVVLIARVEQGAVISERLQPLMYYRRSWGVWSPAQAPGDPEAMRPIEVSARDLRWHGAEL